MSKTIQAISIESIELIKRLEKAQIGETITYDELSKVAMADVKEEKRGALMTAQKHVLNEKQFVFETIRNVGIKRINDSEIVAHAEGPIQRIQRISRRALRRLSCVDFEKLSNREKVLHNTKMSALGMLHHLSAPSKIKQIESAVTKANSRLELTQTLDVFRKN